MKILVVYYSLTGNTKLIAQAIASELRADILEIKTEEDLIKKKRFFKYFWGGKKVVMRECPKINKINKPSNDYDLIFLGTPVWAFSFTPPIRTFLKENKISGKKIVLFCCHGGRKSKVFDNLRKELAGNKFLGEKDFLEPKNEVEKNIKEAQNWAKEIVDRKI